MPVAGSRVLVAARHETKLAGASRVATAPNVASENLSRAAEDVDVRGGMRDPAVTLALAVQDTRRQLREVEARVEMRHSESSGRVSDFSHTPSDKQKLVSNARPVQVLNRSPQLPVTPAAQRGRTTAVSSEITPARDRLRRNPGSSSTGRLVSGDPSSHGNRGARAISSTPPVRSSTPPVRSVASSSMQQRVPARGVLFPDTVMDDQGDNFVASQEVEDDPVLSAQMEIETEIELAARAAIAELRGGLEAEFRVADDECRRQEKRAGAVQQTLRRAKLDCAKTDRQMQSELAEARSEFATAEQRATARIRTLRDSSDRAEGAVPAIRIDIEKIEKDIASCEKEAEEVLERNSSSRQSETQSFSNESTESTALERINGEMQRARHELANEQLIIQELASAMQQAETVCASSVNSEIKAEFENQGSPVRAVQHEMAVLCEDQDINSVRIQRLRQHGGPKACSLRVASECTMNSCHLLAEGLIAERNQTFRLADGLRKARSLLERSEALIHGFRDAWRISAEAADGKLRDEVSDLQLETKASQEQLEAFLISTAAEATRTAEINESRSELASLERIALWEHAEAVQEELFQHRSMAARIYRDLSNAAAAPSEIKVCLSGRGCDYSVVDDLPSSVSNTLESSPISSAPAWPPSSRSIPNPPQRPHERGLLSATLWPDSSRSSPSGGVRGSVAVREESDLQGVRRASIESSTASPPVETNGGVADSESWTRLIERALLAEQHGKAELESLEQKHDAEMRSLLEIAKHIDRCCHDQAENLWRSREASCQTERDIWQLHMSHDVGLQRDGNSQSAVAAHQEATRRAGAHMMAAREAARTVGNHKFLHDKRGVVPIGTSPLTRVSRANLAALSSMPLLQLIWQRAVLSARRDEIGSLQSCINTAETAQACMQKEASLLRDAKLLTAELPHASPVSLSIPRRVGEASDVPSTDDIMTSIGNSCTMLLQQLEAHVSVEEGIDETKISLDKHSHVELRAECASNAEETLAAEVRRERAKYLESLIALDERLDREAALKAELQNIHESYVELEHQASSETQKQATLVRHVSQESFAGRLLEDVYAKRAHDMERLHVRHETATAELQDLRARLESEEHANSELNAVLSNIVQSESVEASAWRAESAKQLELERKLEGERERVDAVNAQFNSGLGVLWDERRFCNRASRAEARGAKEERSLLDELLVAREIHASTWKQLDKMESVHVALRGELDDYMRQQAHDRQHFKDILAGTRTRTPSPARGRRCDVEHDLLAGASVEIAARLASSKMTMAESEQARARSCEEINNAESQVAEARRKLEIVQMQQSEMAKGFRAAAEKIKLKHEEHRRDEHCLRMLLNEAHHASTHAMANAGERLANGGSSVDSPRFRHKEEIANLEHRLPQVLSELAAVEEEVQAMRKAQPPRQPSMQDVSQDIEQLVASSALLQLREKQLLQIDVLQSEQRASHAEMQTALQSLTVELQAAEQRLEEDTVLATWGDLGGDTCELSSWPDVAQQLRDPLQVLREARYFLCTQKAQLDATHHERDEVFHRLSTALVELGDKDLANHKLTDTTLGPTLIGTAPVTGELRCAEDKAATTWIVSERAQTQP